MHQNRINVGFTCSFMVDFMIGDSSIKGKRCGDTPSSSIARYVPRLIREPSPFDAKADWIRYTGGVEILVKNQSILVAAVVFLCLVFFTAAVDAQSVAPAISANYGVSVDNNTNVNLGIQISSGSVSDDFQVTVNASYGELTVTLVSGLSSITGNGTGSVTISGNIHNINAALSSMTFRSDSGFSGTDVISVIAIDLDGSQTGSIQVPVKINDASHIVVPGAISVINNTDLNIRGISVSYPSTASGSLPVTLYVSHGIVTLPVSSGLVYIWGNGTSKVTFIGSFENINAALAGLEYHSAPQYAGTDILTISANDMGDAEYPSLDAVTGTVAINVLDRPHVIVPAKQVQWTPYNAIDSAGLVISGTCIKYDCIGSNNIQVTLADSHGAIILSTSSNLVSMAGNGTGNITITGDLASVNSVLSYMSYQFNTNYSGSDTISITAVDLSSSASGSGFIDINKASVNDLLIVTALQGLPTSNGTGYKLQGFYVTCLNPVNDNMQAVISASHGTVLLPSVTGLEYLSGNGTGSITLAGSLASINSAVAVLTYISAPGYSGTESITLDVTDLNTYKTASGTAVINVIATSGSSAEYTVQLSGSNISIKPALDSSNGTAKSSLSMDDIAGAASNVQQDSNGNRYIKITVAPIAGVNTYKLSLPANVLMDPSVTIRIKITTPLCTVIIPSNLFCGMDTAEKDTVISMTSVDSSGFPSDLKAAIGNRPVIKLAVALDGLNTTWDDKSDPVTVSIPYQASAKDTINAEHIAVWCLNDSGNVYPVPNCRYDASAGAVNFTVTHFGKYAISFVNKTFTDLSNYAWAKEQIEVLASRGIINGTSHSTFNPAANITRGDFIKLLITTLGLTAEITDNFSEGKFKPDAYLTRQDMIIMTAKALEIAKPSMPTGSYSDLSGFSDRSEISLSARDYAGTLVKNRIITGARGKLNPAKFMSRAEAAVILYQLLQFNLFT